VSKRSADGKARKLTGVHGSVLTTRRREEKKFPAPLQGFSRLPACQDRG